MQHVNRLILTLLLVTAMTSGAWAMEGGETATQAAEYKRSDTNFYWKSDIVKAHPSAVIISEGSCTRKGDSYFITPHKKAPKEIYVEMLNDWIEPITPPDMPASLGVPPDAMQIREPQGDVQVALPSAPANFVSVTDGMTLPNGAVIKTGANGTAAVLFGGVDSARLMPDSAAAVQQTVTAQSRSAEVDLTTGGVFSKVGSQVGVKGEYEVHTPFGNAVAHGTDFVTMTTSTRTDVWIAQGTVELDQPDGNQAGVATSDGAGALKILRFPLIADSQQAMLADTETMTAILNFIPMANQKIKGLRDKMAKGAPLTVNEQDYLHRIKQVPCLIKLALVKPPVPAPIPAIASAPTPTPALPPPTSSAPIRAVVRVDGKVNFQGVTFTPAQFQSRLEAIVKMTPDQAILLKAGKKVTYEKFKAVLDVCHSAQVKNLSVATPALTPESTAPEPATANLPTPGLLMHPSMEPTPGNTPSAPPTTNAPTSAVP